MRKLIMIFKNLLLRAYIIIENNSNKEITEHTTPRIVPTK